MKQRIEPLDLWRSLAVVLMIVYHGLYDLELFGVLAAGTTETPWALALRYACSGSFILISGTVLRFSGDPVRRGFLVFCAGLLVSVATALLKQPVKFGILQCIGVCMMLCGVLREKLDSLSGAVFALACAVLFAASWWVTKTITVDIKFLFPLGLRTDDFYSADYYPLFPWLFLYLIGTTVGTMPEKYRKSALLQRKIPRWMTFPGRRSLLIYLLHQPLLYGVTWLLFD